MKKFTDNLLLYIKGLAMGAADVVPGVSGGTIAFVTGIYIELINTIKSVNLRALQTLKSEGIGAAWRFINGRFIVILLAGIFTSLFSLAQFMQYLLVEHPLPLWSFFTGLIVGSVIYLLRQNPLRSTHENLLFFVGIGIAYGISISPPVVLEGTAVTMFLAGSIALCAMILPGISGSFILVLLGLYPVFIGAIANLQIDILTAFALGGIVGLMLFSRLLSWLLARFETLVIATMCGFLMGSLSIIWPWKLVTSSMTTDSGKVLVLSTDNLMPSEFLGLTGGDPQTFLCTVMFVFALSAVMGLDYFAKSKLESTQ
ncbi:MAG: DUF368 domain-containing protein [SAR92 clade bacterium]|uniref:DUF368 domain-containing protein n=1 Tax=SAR92 clade bacterium TaxID=2315479 RepID=A0A520MHH9_9GAMM|nr:MAG: DUF368 domain-containing protein [SAR92 clade bacterium]